MSISSVLIADSSQTSRNLIKDILTKRGYRVYQASDGSGAMRIARTIRPDLVIMDANLWGTNVYETGRLIEGERLSTVIFITAKPDREFTEKLKSMKVFAYVTKPINPAQLIQIVEFSIANSNRIAVLEKRVEKLENSLTARKTVERAKGIIMERLGISEKEAYHRLRKESMDRGITMEKAAGDIIGKYGG
jgi:AmiR/NasT family two-component response regulator